MQINASFSEADIGRLTPGLEVSFTVDAYPGESFKGKLRQIRLNPTITSNVVTYDVIIDVDNPELKLLPGMTAYVDIELYRETGVLLVPNTALNYRPAGSETPAPPAEANSPATADMKVAPASEVAPGNGARPSEAGNPANASGHWGGAKDEAIAEKAAQAEETHGRVYVLDQNGQPRMVNLTLGTSDLRQTVVKSGDLKAGDLVIIGENQPEGDRTLLSSSSGPGGPRRF
jgi:HlyD family secretion protein